VASGETATADLSVEGFENVTSFQFTVTWDPSVAEFSSVGEFNLKGLSGGNFGTPEDESIEDGTLTVVWDDPDAEGKSLSDGTRLLSLELAAAGSEGEETALTFGDDPTAREVTVNFSPVTFDGAAGNVTISSDNQAPAATGDEAQANEDSEGSASAPGVLGNDTDPDADALQVSSVNGSGGDVGTEVTLSSGALLRQNADGAYAYAPNGQFEGLGAGETETDSWTYTAADGSGGTDQATVTVTIDGVNDAPVVTGTLPDRELTADGPRLQLTGLETIFEDPDGGELSLSASSSDPTVVEVTGQQSPKIVGLAPQAEGSAEITVAASDGEEQSAADPFEVTVEEATSGEEVADERASGTVPAAANAPVDLGETGVAATFSNVETGGTVEVGFFGGDDSGKTEGKGGATTADAAEEFENTSPYRWEISVQDIEFESVDVSFSLSDEDVVGVGAPTEVTIIRDAEGGGNFEEVETSYDPDADALVAEGISGFSTFRLASNSQENPLPVELASFEGRSVEFGGEEAIRLTWRTASESENARFRVQRKVEGMPSEWTTIDRREGAGTTTEAQTYRFTDKNLPYEAEELAYRLLQVDMDGSKTPSDPITVSRAGPAEIRLLGTSPNPAGTQATLRFAIPEQVTRGKVRLELYDVMGRRVRSIRVGTEVGRHKQRIDVGELASGTYILRLSTENGVQKTRKMTAVR